jgi:membrane protein YdbS with pleckstrin-like domain
MFCKKCGNQIENGAKFCSKCGSSITIGNLQKTSPIDLNMPIFIIRPVFIPWVTIVSVIPIQLFMTILAGGFLGGFVLFVVEFFNIIFNNNLNLPIWFTFVFFGALVFFSIPFLTYYVKKKTYNKTKYKFYADRVEYTEGFWTAESKTIKYKNIIESYLRKGIVQRKYGIGTIIFFINNNTGFKIVDVENPEEIYERIQLLIDKTT